MYALSIDFLFRRTFLFVVLMGSLLWTTSSFAHPYHVSLTELEFNVDARTLEVAIRMTPMDLERALTRREGKRVNIEHHHEADRLITEYLRSVFVVKTPSGTKLPLKWIGKEIVSHQIAWAYVEFRIPAKVDALYLRNWAFFEISKRQINTVVVKSKARKESFSFSPGADERAKKLSVAPKP